MAIRTRNLIGKKVPRISLRAAAGEAMNDSTIAAEGLEDEGNIHEADRVRSVGIWGASAMELYYAEQNGL